jgi:hypothetical protein
MAKIVPPVTLANHFELIGHFKGADGVNTWRNSIVVKDSSGTPGDISNPIPEVCDFWRRNLITVCNLDHIELRNWARGVQPYSQAPALWTSTQNCGAGTKSASNAYGAEGSEGIGKEVVAFLRILSAPGKEGKMFLRGLFDESDVAAQAGGQWVFIVPGPGNVTPAKFTTLMNATIQTYFLSDPGLRVVHFPVKRYLANPTNPGNLPYSTTISDMSMVGPSVNKSTRKSGR